jgi:transcriptional regulator with XRE-family HTH domain|nr:MAG TPA: helix-turn-helix protein [Inoviridae sp.]
MTVTNLTELISKAGDEAGSLKQLAALMGKNQNRISEWRTGKAKPDAHEIAFMAELAKLPVLQTVAEIESQLDSRYAEVWRAALGKLTAAGVAASVIAALTLAPDEVNSRELHAVGSQMNAEANSVYYVN